MKSVHCSWVDMLKLRESLSAGERGDQAALTQMRCVDHSTIATWKAAIDVLNAMSNGVNSEISHIGQLQNFQPSHAVEIARHLRKTCGKDPAAWDADAVADWVDRCETEKLTVQQLRAAITAERVAAPADDAPCCTVTDLAELGKAGRKFGTIYADPPWAYGNQATRAATDNHYPTMTVEDIAALPVGDLAADQSHLWLWTTNGFLFECPQIFAAWGFEFKSSYVWVKPQIGIGNYLRNSHEFLLLAVRGGLVGAATDVKSWGEFNRQEHSAKPDRIRVDVLERVSPGPRLELFGRKTSPGWTVWGNQIERNLFDTNVTELTS